MTVEVKPGGSVEELRHALNVISHYFGHEKADDDAERFAQSIALERRPTAWDGPGGV